MAQTLHRQNSKWDHSPHLCQVEQNLTGLLRYLSSHLTEGGVSRKKMEQVRDGAGLGVGGDGLLAQL